MRTVRAISGVKITPIVTMSVMFEGPRDDRDDRDDDQRQREDRVDDPAEVLSTAPRK